MVSIEMGFGGFRKEEYVGELLSFLVVLYIIPWLLASTATANVVLVANNLTMSFEDIEANFAPAIKGSGECGKLYVADPIDACLPLTNEMDTEEGARPPFVLIIRGGCTFEDKVRRAQNAGFKAAIVYDNEDNGALIAMAGSAVVAGSSVGIKIHSIFISKAAGDILKQYVGCPNMELWILPTFENSAWSIMVISFVSLLALSIVLGTCFYIRRHHLRREHPQTPHVREFHGMSSRLVKAMPSLIFTTVLEDNCTSSTCAICLEDYTVGEKLRVLPCRHKFHAFCVDAWLTTWRTFCPVCKRDARTSSGDPPASECTPLLPSRSGSVASSSGLSSARSSFAASSAIRIAPSSSRPPSSRSSFTTSSAIRIAPPSSRSPSVSRTHTLSTTPYVQQSFRSYSNSPSPALYLSSSRDLRNASSQRSHASHLVSPHSLGYPSLSPLNSRYISPYIPSSSNASPSYIGSSSHQQYLRRCSESAASFSPFASAQSLPGC
ncbi:PREDICTED: receptor homology region, transmembrane domain- and RING domain-containing protein 2 isoform X2 [Nelumbo nucifera]|uniref:Receptor homology region, transmembrane domain- and RING domain-containing protein 2 isoform X2 n=1 Tax=Nelumbo nucifera TaxID=4432 RepID=A0A1U7ZSE1_NELNU|nr:PREDICTED: receptor homology region, transmembrane domain- and RING domain-containing protein 2 isoform X2 [Nelumbo nucifera]